MLAVAIVNKSTKFSASDLDLTRVAIALQRQLVEHVQPLFRILPPALSFEASGNVPQDASPLVIFDDADQAGALGYHSETPQGLIYGRVFLAPIFGAGGRPSSGDLSVSSVLSHELLEMLGDPPANIWADGVDGKSYAYELCDPVEGDSYAIGQVAVSNFVLPSWFDPSAAQDARFDFLSRLAAPFTMTAGGYMITRDATGQVSQVYGHARDAWRMAGKLHPASRTSRRLARAAHAPTLPAIPHDHPAAP